MISDIPCEVTKKKKAYRNSHATTLCFLQRNLPLDTFFQRNNSFCTLDPFKALYIFIQHLTEVSGISTDNFGKHTILTRTIMQLYNLFHLSKLLHGICIL